MFELVLLADEAAVDALTDQLIEELQALSAAVEDADASRPAEQALFGEPGLPAPRSGWNRSRVVALFADEALAQTAAMHLLAGGRHVGLHVEVIRPVADQDWVRLTQAQFEPVAITSDFWIVPTWHTVPAAAARAIRLDPGLAFGTGTHPTTRMCLRWIAGTAPSRATHGSRVLDYGCGSGVLAIAAALHGVQAVDAVDLDPAAVQASTANAAANGVAIRCGLPEAAHGIYSLVLANILATPLKLLAPLLCEHVATGGQLVLAGMLARQADDLAAAYAPWLALSVVDEDDGWILMTGTRSGDALAQPSRMA
jgi:ribosomal protein L11 methyltransferase